jgi:hypothetical protein
MFSLIVVVKVIQEWSSMYMKSHSVTNEIYSKKYQLTGKTAPGY